MAEVQESQPQSTLGKENADEVVDESSEYGKGETPQELLSSPPKVDSEVEVLHEKVTKQIIKEGHVHYRAWAENTEHKFEDTWQEQRPTEMIIGKEKKEMTGLGIGVASMKAGERALLRVSWELGYGKEGSFSFPNGKARSDMTVEERIGAADRRKMDGNVLFQENKLEEAMQQYEMAIAYMGDDFMFQLFGKYRDMALAVKNPCHLNTAACLIKLNRYEEAIGQCSIVLSEDENNLKALFRRGKARAALGQTDAAREDFLKARKHAPEDKAIARELKLLAEHDKAIYQKQKEIYKGIFGPRPQPVPKKRNLLLLVWQWLVSVFYSFITLFNREKNKSD
ncbi:hypothetical protein TSUD_269140 [Trifolium subterraneum]|uniref:peptidylprolyl isomerase n=1 Tax=Trifolium subterraneum TaxID=3900 RepID=A0A2Z6M7Y0_TRISU|nr:hypothetical protein TSUD_269140 [Trifolium subterraneum]